MSNGGSQPPMNNMTVMELINIILAYSPRKNRTNEADEYSVKNPATKVDSSSGKKIEKLNPENNEVWATVSIWLLEGTYKNLF